MLKAETGTGRWIGRMLALAVLGAAGCTDITVRTTLHPDGGGQRWEEKRVSHNAENSASVSHEEYVYLMDVGEENGWTHTTRMEEDTVHVFQREHRVPDLTGWSRLDGTIRITGATKANADVRVGNAVLGEGRFSNRVRVGRGTTSDGRRTFTYRESFYWEHGADPLVEYVARDFTDSVAAMYAPLDSERRGQLIGLVRGGLWAAIDRGFAGGRSEADEDELLETFIRRTVDEVVKTLRPDRPDMARGAFEATLRGRVADEERVLAWADSLYPGFELATDTSIEFRLLMPGRVTASNADRVEGDTLVWKFGPEDALARPFEIHAESIM